VSVKKKYSVLKEKEWEKIIAIFDSFCRFGALVFSYRVSIPKEI